METFKLDSGVSIRRQEGEAGNAAIFCVHGFGASSRSFLEAFAAPELRHHRVLAPDFPGFGESPRGTGRGGLYGAADLLVELVSAFGGGEEIVLLGHSAGGLVVSMAAPRIARLRGLVSVEGNLTAADNFVSGKVAVAGDVEAWRRDFLALLGSQAGPDEATRRYCRDMAQASPVALREWARETVAETGDTLGGERFLTIACPKLYVYGGRSIPPPSLAFLVRHDLPRLAFPDAGHSPMIDEPSRFYAALAGFIAR